MFHCYVSLPECNPWKTPQRKVATLREDSTQGACVMSNSVDDSAWMNFHGFFRHFFCVFLVHMSSSIWGFPKIVVHRGGWFIMETPIKMDDLGVPQF